MKKYKSKEMTKAGYNIRTIDNYIKDEKQKIKNIKRKRINVDEAVEKLLSIIN